MRDNKFSNLSRILLLLCCFGNCLGGQGVAEYCEDELFVAECQQDEVILVESALYGRMQLGRCVTKNYGNIGCAIDVRAHLDEWCSGRQSCEVPVTNLLRGSSKPCPKDFRSYLEASYSCLPIINVEPSSCQHTSFVRVDATEGYIASTVTGNTGCGTIDTPWYLEAKPGQRINITLWDFDVINQVTSSRGPGGMPTPCHVYAIIKEKDYTSSKTVCPDGSRISHVMMSQGNQVEIRIVTKRKDQSSEEEGGQFLLHFNVVGCPDIAVSGDAFFERRSHSAATYGCKSTEEKWQLTCVNNKWKGNYEKCSAVGGDSNDDSMWGVVTSSHGMSIAIIIAVAVLVGILILITGLICLRWRRYKYAESRKQLSDDGRHYGYAGSQVAKAYDPYGSAGENNYYRTWEMQRHGGLKDGRDIPVPPPPYNHTSAALAAAAAGCDGADVMNPRYVEHIYESPKFERRQFSDEHGRAGILEFNPTQQYFELDPDVVTNKPSEASTSSGRNIQFSPRNFSAPRM